MEICDYGKIELGPQEMVSFRSASGKECDFAAYSWGFYVAPSLNDRLKQQGFKAALVLNVSGKIFINVVEKEKLAEFQAYLVGQKSRVLSWLDEWSEV
jgi:hypothetical protein